MCGSEALCIVESPAAPLEGGGGLAEQRHARAQHASATACMESSWPRTKYDPITWRRCWSAGLQGWGSVSQPSTTKAQSRARPNRHHGQRQKRTVSFPPLTPPLSGWWAKAQSHRHTLFPFGLISSNRLCLVFSESRHTACIWGM